MAEYDFSKPAPDRSHRIPLDSGSAIGGFGLVLVGAVIVLSVLYAVFGGAVMPDANGAEPAAVVTTEN